MGFPSGSDGKESACNAGDLGSIPGLGRFPGGEGMATNPCILACEIPWTEERGGLHSMGAVQLDTSGHDKHICKLKASVSCICKMQMRTHVITPNLPSITHLIQTYHKCAQNTHISLFVVQSLSRVRLFCNPMD